MSSPSINRWGLNLFWYRYWYNDKNSSLINHQDSLINKLIVLYINYGVLHYKNFFINKYWYPNLYFKYKNYESNHLLKYFRIVEYKNRATGENKSYKLRIKSKNLYSSKLWILRYQGWLLINFYFFQPAKSRAKRKRKTTRSLDTYLFDEINKLSIFNRHRLIFYSIVASHLVKNAYQNF